MTDIEGGFANRFKSNTRQWDLVKSGFTRFKDGDIAVAKITPCFENRKSVIFTDLKNGYGAGTTELHILRTTVLTCSKYIFWFIKSEFFIQNGIGHFSGAVGQQRVGKDVFQNTYFPLPPLAEQKRIASKIESLFSILDAMEEECD
jgi:type I restriction enzyme S subunit